MILAWKGCEVGETQKQTQAVLLSIRSAEGARGSKPVLGGERERESPLLYCPEVTAGWGLSHGCCL